MKDLVKKYYDQEAGIYIDQYKNQHKWYPFNLIRINMVAERLAKNGAKTVLDMGCGTCGPMIKLLKQGFDIKGFDFSEEMVQAGKEELKKEGFDPERVFCADVEGFDIAEKFDASIALGVFPHVLDEKKSLLGMKSVLNKNGLVFVEFRNDLFASYTFNKFSVDFFNRLINIDSLPQEIKSDVAEYFAKRMDVPVATKNEKITYGQILAKMHNPLTIREELFEPCGFGEAKIHFYHYHALPPCFQSKYTETFNDLSMQMEKPNDWRGHFLASAFVMEARAV